MTPTDITQTSRHSLVENRETFFNRVRQIWPQESSEYQLIEKAYTVAAFAHTQVVREDTQATFEHARAVAFILLDELDVTGADAICTALLHTIIEADPNKDALTWPVSRLRKEFNARIAENVWIFTKPRPGQVLPGGVAYHLRFWFVERPIAVVKLADRLHSMRTQTTTPRVVPPCRNKEEGEQFLPLARFHNVLVEEFERFLTTPPHPTVSS